MSTKSDELAAQSGVKTTLTIAIPPELKKLIEEDAAQDDRSVSNYVVRVLERRHQLTQNPTKRKRGEAEK